MGHLGCLPIYIFFRIGCLPSADEQLGHRGNSYWQIWVRPTIGPFKQKKPPRPSIFYGPMFYLIGSRSTSTLLPARAGREPPNPGAERGDRGRKTRRRSRRAPPPELRDGRRKRLRLAVLRFSAPAPSRCHQVLRFEFDLAHAPLVYPLACVALSFTGHLPRTVVARALAAPPLSPCGGSFAQVMRSDEREISWLGLLQEEPYPDQGSGSVW